jgi:hypothetical protein
MEKLLQYIESLKTEPERIAFGKRCGTTIGYLRKRAYSKKENHFFKVGLCVRIEEESGGVVSRKDLRSDWAENWPELREAA